MIKFKKWFMWDFKKGMVLCSARWCVKISCALFYKLVLCKYNKNQFQLMYVTSMTNVCPYAILSNRDSLLLATFSFSIWLFILYFNNTRMFPCKDVGDGATSEARASPLFSLLHKEISLQMKIIGNHVISIAECWFL